MSQWVQLAGWLLEPTWRITAIKGDARGYGLLWEVHWKVFHARWYIQDFVAQLYVHTWAWYILSGSITFFKIKTTEKWKEEYVIEGGNKPQICEENVLGFFCIKMLLHTLYSCLDLTACYLENLIRQCSRFTCLFIPPAIWKKYFPLEYLRVLPKQSAGTFLLIDIPESLRS